MKNDVRIQELNEKIDKKTRALTSAIKSQIEQKNQEVCKTLEKSIRKEKSEIKRASIKFLEKIHIRIEGQAERILKMRAKIDKVTLKLQELEKKASIENIGQIKLEIEKDLKEKFNKIDKIREDQRKIYKHEFESLTEECAGITQTGYEKLKRLL